MMGMRLHLAAVVLSIFLMISTTHAGVAPAHTRTVTATPSSTQSHTATADWFIPICEQVCPTCLQSQCFVVFQDEDTDDQLPHINGGKHYGEGPNSAYTVGCNVTQDIGLFDACQSNVPETCHIGDCTNGRHCSNVTGVRFDFVCDIFFGPTIVGEHKLETAQQQLNPQNAEECQLDCLNDPQCLFYSSFTADDQGLFKCCLGSGVGTPPPAPAGLYSHNVYEHGDTFGVFHNRQHNGGVCGHTGTATMTQTATLTSRITRTQVHHQQRNNPLPIIIAPSPQPQPQPQPQPSPIAPSQVRAQPLPQPEAPVLVVVPPPPPPPQSPPPSTPVTVASEGGGGSATGAIVGGVVGGVGGLCLLAILALIYCYCSGSSAVAEPVYGTAGFPVAFETKYYNSYAPPPSPAYP